MALSTWVFGRKSQGFEEQKRRFLWQHQTHVKWNSIADGPSYRSINAIHSFLHSQKQWTCADDHHVLPSKIVHGKDAAPQCKPTKLKHSRRGLGLPQKIQLPWIITVRRQHLEKGSACECTFLRERPKPTIYAFLKGGNITDQLQKGQQAGFLRTSQISSKDGTPNCASRSPVHIVNRPFPNHPQSTCIGQEIEPPKDYPQPKHHARKKNLLPQLTLYLICGSKLSFTKIMPFQSTYCRQDGVLIYHPFLFNLYLAKRICLQRLSLSSFIILPESLQPFTQKGLIHNF